MTHRSPGAGVILCGGRASRMGGADKGNLQLAGKTLLQRVIDRFEGQVEQLVLSVDDVGERFAVYELEQVPDPRPGHRGPLGGLLSALRYVAGRYEWLTLVPCDAPFLPLNLVERLQQAAGDSSEAGCIVSYQGEVQPTFSTWHRSLLPSLEVAVLQQGMAGFKQFLDQHPLCLLEWEAADPSPFFNINDPQSLAIAQTAIEGQ